MLKNTGYDIVVIKAVNTADTSKESTVTKYIQNEEDMYVESGSYVYDRVVAGTITNGYIDCTGGTATATANNGTQRLTTTTAKTTKT